MAIKIRGERLIRELHSGYTGPDTLEHTDLSLKIGKPDINVSHDRMHRKYKALPIKIFDLLSPTLKKKESN